MTQNGRPGSHMSHKGRLKLACHKKVDQALLDLSQKDKPCFSLA